MTVRLIRTAVAVAAAIALGACVPKAGALGGAAAAPARIPRAELLHAPQLVVFAWSYEDTEMRARGEGSARLTAPDSARLDLFLAGGLGSGTALIFGDSLILPSNAGLIKRFIPPVAMFWAAIGRLAVGPGDTTVRVDGALTRADIARGGSVMRVSFDGERLASLERIADGGIQERVTRLAEKTEYQHLGARRRLTLVITRTTNVAGFDASIWQH